MRVYQLATAIDDSALDTLSALPHADDQKLLDQIIHTYINTSMDLIARLGEALDLLDEGLMEAGEAVGRLRRDSPRRHPASPPLPQLRHLGATVHSVGRGG